MKKKIVLFKIVPTIEARFVKKRGKENKTSIITNVDSWYIHGYKRNGFDPCNKTRKKTRHTYMATLRNMKCMRTFML